MPRSQVIDWRVWKAAEVAEDGPPIVPGGSPIQKGDMVYAISTIRDSKAGRVTFITPGPVQLALSVSIRAAKEADAARAKLVWTREGPATPEKWATKENIPRLYAYFENAMIAAVFAFQALESYSNQIIVMSLHGKMKLKRHKDEVEWSAAEIERNASTDEKLATILPALFNKNSPKGTKVWENYVKLKAIRDATIHLKDLDQYVRGTEDTQTLYYWFLTHDAVEFPQRAIAMIRHFVLKGTDSWLVPAEALLKSDSQRQPL